MRLSRRISLIAALLSLLVFLYQIDSNLARPSRVSRRSKGTGKGKRNWPQSAGTVIMDDNAELSNIDMSILPLPLFGDDAAPLDPMESESTPKALSPSNKWLELEKSNGGFLAAPLYSDLTLECTAVGSPPPRVYWLKNGKPVNPMSAFDMDKMSNAVVGWSSLFKREQFSSEFSMANVKAKLPLRCLRPEDEGEYTCVAESDGKQVVSSYNVAIDDSAPGESKEGCMPQYVKKGKKIQPAFIMSYEYLHMETIGNDVILGCHAVGRPRPKITWVDFEGKPVSTGKKFKITETGNLVIRKLSWKDMGEYTCKAENDFASDSASTFLYPLLSESDGS